MDAAREAMIEENHAHVAAQAEQVRELKKNMQESKNEIDEAIAKLVELKELFAGSAASKEKAEADAAEQKAAAVKTRAPPQARTWLDVATAHYTGLPAEVAAQPAPTSSLSRASVLGDNDEVRATEKDRRPPAVSPSSSTSSDKDKGWVHVDVP
jgi:peptidoglycan hydrolase CwlO-like protein